MTLNPDVLVIGRNCVDYLAVIERFPEEDEKVPLVAKHVEGGGQAGTSACCVAKLGGNVVLAGTIGDDDAGKFCLRRLEEFNVNIGHVRRIVDRPTPVAYLFVTRSSGKRTIIYEPNLLPPVTLDAGLLQLVPRTKVLSLDPQTTYLANALQKEPFKKIKVIYDCERWLGHIEEMMSRADYFIPSSVFFASRPAKFRASDLCGNILTLQGMVRGQVIVTHGADGAYYPYEDAIYQVPAPTVSVVDTTGAGDNFHGAFALAISRGFNLHQAVKLAVAVASLSCRGYGGREALPDWSEAVDLAGRLRRQTV